MTANQILSIVFRRRRLLESELTENPNTASSDPSVQEVEIHLRKIEAMISRGLTIDMILPAFPGKSPNRNKTLSKWPDCAEKHAIDNLHRLCQEIQAIYAPGATITICSDGYVFADLVRISDEDVREYSDELIAYYRARYPSSFRFFDLNGAFPRLGCLDTIREELMVRYGESLVDLKERCKTERELAAMYRGITRFLHEDFLGLEQFRGQSKAQLQKLARSAAYRVIQRSNAWSRLLEERFPESLRLSIHPQYRISNKIGIHMVQTDDCWRTPWHSVAVERNGQIHLEKRCEVDENINRLIFQNGRPFCYSASEH